MRPTATTPDLTAEHVRNAARLLSGIAVHTPLLRSRALDRVLGCTVAYKAEMFQHTNAFKFRGAYSRVAGIEVSARDSGVVGASSGNHAQALALTSRMLGVGATVVVPDDCPRVKTDAITAHGARIVRYRRTLDDRDSLVADVSRRTGASIVPSSDDYGVMAGNGTVAWEMLADDPSLDTLLVPLGGGGLAAGCATAAMARNPRIRVIGVEPEGADDTHRSWRLGEQVTLPAPATIADGLRHATPSGRALAVNRRLLDDIVLVSDDQIIEAMRLAYRHLGVVVEPSGACAMAALLTGRIRGARSVGVVLSGGNVGDEDFLRLTGLRVRSHSGDGATTAPVGDSVDVGPGPDGAGAGSGTAPVPVAVPTEPPA